MLYESLSFSVRYMYVRVFVHEGSAYWSIQQFRGHAGIGRNIGLVGECKGEFLSFLFITGGKGREEILGVPWRVDVSSLLPCREDLVLIRRMPEIATSRKDSRGYSTCCFCRFLTNLFMLLQQQSSCLFYIIYFITWKQLFCCNRLNCKYCIYKIFYLKKNWND